VTRDDVVFQGSARASRVALVSLALGAVLLLAGAFTAPERLYLSYLTAYAYAVSIAAGALLFLMTVHTMRAGWPVVVRRLVEAIVAALPLLALLSLPLLLGLGRLYPWVHHADIAVERDRLLVERKLPYLNVPFFLVRSVLYLASWILAGELLRRWSLARDRDLGVDAESRAYRFSAGFLPVIGVTLSFAAFDWLMSLTPTWFSTMFPVYYFAGGFLAALALITALAYSASTAGRLPGMSASHYYALGRLLLAFVIFWAYAAYFQFFIQWIADEPEEVTYYIDRSRGPWLTVSVVLVVVQFVIPFFLLLSYYLKRRPPQLAAVAVWILCAHYIDVHWMVMPSAVPDGPAYHWLDLGALLSVGGASVLFALARMRGEALLPVNDPALARGLRYESR
jgi:hypothetical protein